MEANVIESTIAKKLATDAGFIAFCTNIAGEPLKIIIGNDPERAEPESDYPCVVMSVTKQSAHEDILRSLQFFVILKSEMRRVEVDGYFTYPDAANSEKVAREIYALVSKLCSDDNSYYYEKLDVIIQNEAVGGKLEIVTTDILNIGEEKW